MLQYLFLIGLYHTKASQPERWEPIETDYEYHATKSFLYGHKGQETEFIQSYYQV